MTNIELTAVITITLAITSALKYAGLKKRWLPLTSIGLGIITTVIFADTKDYLTIISGVFMGLSTSGLYDFSKYTLLGSK